MVATIIFLLLSNTAHSQTLNENSEYIYYSDSVLFLKPYNTIYLPGVRLPAFTLTGKTAYPTNNIILLPGDENPLYAGQCVNWIKYQTGWDLKGNAIDWQKHINSQIAKVNSVIVLNTGKFGHLGIVTSIDENTITFRSRNYLKLWKIDDMTINKSDSRIEGYIIPTWSNYQGIF